MPSRNEPPPSTFRSRALRALAYLASIALIAAYCFAFLSRGFSEYSDEKVDFVRAGRILEQGLDGFYDEDAHISPYPPFALLALALFRAAFPTLTAFKTAFFLLLLFDGLLFYLSLRRYNAGPAPFFTLLFLTFPFLRLGVVTLHPTDYLFLLFVLLSVYIHRANDSASLALLGLSVATKWYTAFSAFLLPFVYRRDREFAVKSASILPLSIFFGLIFPAFVFPNYLRIYVLHAEKSIGQIRLDRVLLRGEGPNLKLAPSVPRLGRWNGASFVLGFHRASRPREKPKLRLLHSPIHDPGGLLSLHEISPPPFLRVPPSLIPSSLQALLGLDPVNAAFLP